MPRDIGTVPPSVYKDERKVPFKFLRMIWPSPTGTLYWTTYPGDSFDHDVGFGSVTWDGTKVWIPGQTEQGDQGSLSVTDITFGNANNVFSDMMKLQPYGCRGIPVDLYEVPFTADEPHVPAGDRVILFQGLLDHAEVGDMVKVSLKAFTQPLTVPYPQRRYAVNWGFNWIPPSIVKFNFGISGQVSLPTSKTPGTPPPGPGGGGLPGNPPVGGDPNARMPIVRVGRGRGGTHTAPPRAEGGRGRSTRTVPR